MVKKYFRTVVLTACIVMASSSIGGSYAIAADVSTETAQTEPTTEKQTEPITEAPTEKQTDATEAPTEKQTEATEAPTEAQTEAPTEKQTDATEAPTEAPTEKQTDATEAPTETQTEKQTEATEAPTEGTEKEEASLSGTIVSDKEGNVTVGDEAKFSVSALKMKGADTFEATITSTAGTTISAVPFDGEGISSATEKKQESTSSVTTGYAYKLDSSSFSADEKDKFTVTFDEARDANVSILIKAYDKDGAVVGTTEKTFKFIVAEKESTNKEAQISYDKSVYAVGDEVKAEISASGAEGVDTVVVEYEIPGGVEFKNINTLPEFSGGTVKTEYKNANGEYLDTLDADKVKAIRFTVEKSAEKIEQTKAAEILMKAVSKRSGSTEVKTTFVTEKENEVKTNTADLKVDQENVTVSISQTPEVAIRGGDITQNVAVNYINPTASKIVYTAGTGVDIIGLNVGSNTYLEGGKAIVYYGESTAEVNITANLDLSQYAGANRIEIIPKIAAYDGMNGNFAVSLKVNSDITEYACQAAVNYEEDGVEKSVLSELTSKVAYVEIAKPVVSHENKRVDFGVPYTMTLDAFDMNSYAAGGTYEYSMAIPSFVTVNSITVPEVDGAEKVSLYVTSDDGKETFVGEYAGGTVVDIAKKGITSVAFRITPAGDSLKTVSAAKIVFTSEDKNNKTNYFAFRAEARGVVGEQEDVKTSTIQGVTFEIFKRTEVDETEQTEPSQTSGGGSGGGGTITPGPSTSETETSETEDPAISERKKQEQERKEQAKKNALIKEQENVKKQQALLSGRIAAIRKNAVGETGTNGTTKASDKKDAWGIKPIPESIVKNTVPEKIAPINEEIIEAMANSLLADS